MAPAWAPAMDLVLCASMFSLGRQSLCAQSAGLSSPTHPLSLATALPPSTALSALCPGHQRLQKDFLKKQKL